MPVDLWNRPFQFRVGERVKVIHKAAQARAWNSKWMKQMDSSIGCTSPVIQVDRHSGYLLENGFWFPSCSLESLDARPVAKPKKKRVRVGPGPWDAAPCKHLRWNLMGFYRSSLLVATPLTITCKRCNVETTIPVNIGGAQ